MIPYFTTLHWLNVLFFLILFIFLVILSIKALDNKKTLLSMIFFSFLITVFSAVIGLIILEKYTKKAEVLNLVQRKVSLNEVLVLKGEVKNVGKFRINYCKLEIKLINLSDEKKRQKESFFFKSSGLDILGSKEQKQLNVIEVTRVIIKDTLLPGEVKSFATILPCPSYFNDVYLKYKLYCH